MRVLVMLLGYTALMFATVAHTVEQTLVVQDTGAHEVQDTWISSNDWDSPPQHTVNYGRNALLILTRDGDETPLLRFDLGAVPANSAIHSATLSLYNTTQSSGNANPEPPRRIQAFRVLQDWDEGNQVRFPIDAAGKHGATGDHAFDFYQGEGIDVPWTGRGMSPGADYAETPENAADVTGPGWYDWDLTALAREWIRGEQANYGVVLRDATGYQDGNPDAREFVSSQGADAARRPRLTLVFDPDVPYAVAGADQASWQWDGGTLLLDGSASHDRPGGGDASLEYEWRVLRAAYGSHYQAGDLLGAGSVLTFTPDQAGKWELELRVTNDLNATASDTLALSLWSIGAAHPRLHLTPARLTALRARAAADTPRWQRLISEAQEGDLHAQALVGIVTEDSGQCRAAIAAVLAMTPELSRDRSDIATDIALVYDWCHSYFSAAERDEAIIALNAWANDRPKGEDQPGWGNYWPRYGLAYALIGLATYGDNAQAEKWLAEYREARFEQYDLPNLDFIAAGGGWPEGSVYDGIANHPRLKAVDAWQSATGENLFLSTDWFRDRLGYLLLDQWPGVADNWGTQFHPYPSLGDAERNRGSMMNYGRIVGLILIDVFPNEPEAANLQAYLATPPGDEGFGFLAHDEFIWFNPDRYRTTPRATAHYAPGTGTLLLRSGWPDGAADTDPAATWMRFQCGDHFTYHQHFEQNAFTLFKRGDLAVDSGVYSQEGLSYHDQNYYLRTIAHNTLVVYNPDEDFQHARPDATSNDGGQRSVYPASRSPQSVEEFQQYAAELETCDILRYAHEENYSYVLSDATAAYNNSTYNQAMNTFMAGNRPKVEGFQREFLYLRPTPETGDEFLVLFDRVGVSEPGFSGPHTKLLFHTLNEPSVVDGDQIPIAAGETLYTGGTLASADNGDGRLFLKTLLPAARNLRKVGGRGERAFWVFGENYDWHWDPSEPQPRPTNGFEDQPYGEWRLELEPADSGLDHNFLTVLHPTDTGTAEMPETTLVEAGAMQGVHIASAGLARVALFSNDQQGAGPTGSLTYTVPAGATAHLLLDLAPAARYRLTPTAEGSLTRIALTRDPTGLFQVNRQGVLAFHCTNLGCTPDIDGIAKNLSTRAYVTPDFPMHGGIVVAGDVDVLVTARGPSTHLSTALPDTRLTLYAVAAGTPPEELGGNDDWGSNGNKARIASVTANRPLNPKEAAMLRRLHDGAYTAVVRNQEPGDSGEVVLGFTLLLGDADDGDRARNLSTRGYVTPGYPMHGGIVVEGNVQVLITARGNSSNLQTALSDTSMDLFKIETGTAPILSHHNDDWESNANAGEIANLTASRPLAPAEAALLVTLSSGSYTAVVKDHGNGDSGEVVLGFTITGQ